MPTRETALQLLSNQPCLPHIKNNLFLLANSAPLSRCFHARVIRQRNEAGEDGPTCKPRFCMETGEMEQVWLRALLLHDLTPFDLCGGKCRPQLVSIVGPSSAEGRMRTCRITYTRKLRLSLGRVVPLSEVNSCLEIAHTAQSCISSR